MDHLMPGMDGFQALQAIKNNPRTATIPIMMYTSQEGELYLGQARALGAVGVLPKQIKHADVSKVLYQLHLVQPTGARAAQIELPAGRASRPLDEPDPQAATTGIAHSVQRCARCASSLPNCAMRSTPHRSLISSACRRIARAPERCAARAADAARCARGAALLGWPLRGVAVAAALVATALWQHEVNLHDAAAVPVLAAPQTAAPGRQPRLPPSPLHLPRPARRRAPAAADHRTRALQRRCPRRVRGLRR